MEQAGKRILYLDCGMGAAGDMICAALYELLDPEDKKTYLSEMNASGMDNVSVKADSAVRAGITGTHMSVLIDGAEEHAHHHDHEHHHDDEHHHEHGHEHHHDYEHEHHHEHEHSHEHHHHASLAEVHDIIRSTSFSDGVKNDACAIYDIIAQAESKAHGREVGEIHFHEVGMKDAIIDVLGACRLMEMLSPSIVIASEVCTGFGEVRCAHGIVPVPAPATAYILAGVPVYAGDIRGEMCTPTGAAVLKYFVKDYANMPHMTVERTGYGCGTRDFERANCLRAMIGYGSDKNEPEIVELSVNVDDMTGEALGYAADIIREAGALEVFYTPVFMKKNRPGYLLTVLCRETDEERLSALIFKHTSTWGIRRHSVERRYMETRFEERQTPFGAVRFKTGEGYGCIKTKPEYDDLARIAKENNMSINEVTERISDCRR